MAKDLHGQTKHLFNVLRPLCLSGSAAKEIASLGTQNDSGDKPDTKFSLCKFPIKSEASGCVLLGVSCGKSDVTKCQCRNTH